MSLHLTTSEHTRLRWLRIFILSALGILVIALWHIQVGHGEHYANNLEQQSVRRVRIPGVRGKIYDRQGVCLADNAPNYGIALYLEELRPEGKRPSGEQSGSSNGSEVGMLKSSSVGCVHRRPRYGLARLIVKSAYAGNWPTSGRA